MSKEAKINGHTAVPFPNTSLDLSTLHLLTSSKTIRSQYSHCALWKLFFVKLPYEMLLYCESGKQRLYRLCLFSNFLKSRSTVISLSFYFYGSSRLVGGVFDLEVCNNNVVSVHPTPCPLNFAPGSDIMNGLVPLPTAAGNVT